jgi:hypothetical protein
MVPPPRDVYSAIIHNKSAVAATVSGQYKLPDGSSEAFGPIAITAGEHASVAQKVIPQGSMTLTAVIQSVKVVAGAHSVDLHAPFNVHSPTKDYVFEIVAGAAEGQIDVHHRAH